MTTTPAKAISKARTKKATDDGEREFGVAFQSVHQDVTKVWDDYARERKRWLDRLSRIRREHLDGAEVVSTFHPTRHDVLGYALEDGADPLPGWRSIKRNRLGDGGFYADPIPEGAKGGRSDEAKAARELLHKMQPPKTMHQRFGARFGMPMIVMGGTRDGQMAIHYPAVRKLKDGTILLYWDCSTSTMVWDGKTLDGIEYFRPLKVSEYYALQGR